MQTGVKDARAGWRRPSVLPWLLTTVVFLAANGLGACSEAVPPAAAGRTDAGTTDGGTSRTDGGAPAGDGGAVGDDAAIDASPPTDSPDGGPGEGCHLVRTPYALTSAMAVATDAPSIGARNDGAVVAWVMAIDAEPRVSTLWFPSDPMIPPSVLTVSSAAEVQRAPQVGVRDGGYVVAWREGDGTDEQSIRARYVDATGAAEGDGPLTVTAGARASPPPPPEPTPPGPPGSATH